MKKSFLFLLLTSLSSLVNAKEIKKNNSVLSKTDFIENIRGDMAGFAKSSYERQIKWSAHN